jgi:PEP-CTERM motif
MWHSISPRRARLGRYLAAIVFFAAIAGPQFATAGTVTFSVPTIDVPYSATQNQTGSFDVSVSEPGGGNILAQFNFDLHLNPGSTGVAFTDVSYGLSYVFAGNSGEEMFGPPVFFDANEVSNSDTVNTNPGPTLSSTLLAMEQVTFDVPAGTPAGTYPLTFNQDNPATDPFGDWVNTISNNDPGNFQPGATINGAIVVTPEPSSALLVLLGAAGLLGFRRLCVRWAPRLGHSLAVLALLAAALATPGLAGAGDIIFSVPTIDVPYSATQNQTGFFDVTVYETGGSDKLYAFQTDLFVNQAGSNVQFITYDLNTTAPYVFPGHVGGGDLIYPLPNVEEANSDSADSNSSAPALSTSPLGLMRVEYDVLAGAPIGSYALTFNQDNPATDPFADYVNTISITDTNLFTVSVVNGAIVVVPEPSSALLVLLGAAGLLGFRRLRACRAPRLGHSLAVLALLAAAIAAPQLARAGAITFSIANQTAPVSTGDEYATVGNHTGTLDVVVSETGGGNLLAQFAVDLFLHPGSTAITLTGATLNTTAPYVFAGNSAGGGTLFQLQ